MSWKEDIELKLTQSIGRNIIIESVNSIGGGSINETLKLTTNEGCFFIKKNSASRFPKIFEKEEMGIELLSSTNEIDAGEVIATGVSNDTSFLILKYIKSGIKTPTFWYDFGKQLANLHKHTVNFFGLDYNNYIGSLIQRNNKHSSWTEFFINERLSYQVKMARDNKRVDKDTISSFDRFYNRMDSIFPVEPSALLHGDLWSGNYMVNENGQPVIIDPAVYYGHREMDLGMSQLFGGFDNQFYTSYHNHFPLENGWKERLQFCNLYPLMVHVNLFGGTYLNSVKEILRKF